MSGQTDGTGSGDRTWTRRLIGPGIVLGILLLFIVLNSDDVEVSLLVISPEMPLGLALLIAAGLGFLAGLLFPRFRRSGTHRR
jgi:uncharacterized integral membrane protein